MTDRVGFIGVAERLAPYEFSVDIGSRVHDVPLEEDAIDDLMEKAALLLAVMPPNQRRETIEKLVAPDDPSRGRRAVDALLEAGHATEDVRGHLHRAG